MRDLNLHPVKSHELKLSHRYSYSSRKHNQITSGELLSSERLASVVVSWGLVMLASIIGGGGGGEVTGIL